MRNTFAILSIILSLTVSAHETGIPASDTLGAEDTAGNPSFIGGVANSGSTAHGVW